MQRRRAEPLLANFIVAECHALLLARPGGTIVRAWLLGNAWPTERVTEDDEARARAIIARYGDRTYSYADATSLAVMERCGLKVASAFDPHVRHHVFQLPDGNP